MENYTDPVNRLPVWERPEAIPFDLDSPEFWRRLHEHISPKHMADTFGRWCEDMDRKEWEAQQKAQEAEQRAWAEAERIEQRTISAEEWEARKLESLDSKAAAQPPIE